LQAAADGNVNGQIHLVFDGYPNRRCVLGGVADHGHHDHAYKHRVHAEGLGRVFYGTDEKFAHDRHSGRSGS